MTLSEVIRHWFMSEVLSSLRTLRGDIMATFAELQAKFDSILAGLNAVEADVQRLHDALANATGGLTATETEALAAQAQGILDRVSAIDAATPEP